MTKSKKYQIASLVCTVLAAAFLIVFFNSLLSCSSGKAQGRPEEALERFVAAVNHGNYEEAQSVISSGSTVVFGDAGENKALKAVFDTAYRNFGIEIVSKVVLGGKASVEADITFFDMRLFASDVYAVVQQRAYEQSYAGHSISSESQANALVSEVELELLAGDAQKYITTERMEIKLEISDGQWRIIADDAFYNVLSGYASQIEIEKEVSAENE